MLIKGREYDVVKIGLGLLAVAALSSAVWNWYHPKTTTVTRTEYQTVEKEKIVEKIKTVKVPGPKEIVTIEKIVIVEKLKLPRTIADNPDIVITGNADLPPSVGGTSVVSTLNTATGVTEIIAKQKPLPLFGFPSDVELGARYGVSTTEIQAGNIYARWQFLRVGKVHVGAYGELGTRPEAKAMVDVSFKF